MNRAIAWFASNHVAANLLMMVIVLGGLATMPTIIQELIPAIELDPAADLPPPARSPAGIERERRR